MNPNEFKENSWRRLLDEIENGQIIPIIGAELLIVSVNDRDVPLYEWISSELAKRLDIEFDKEKLDISDIIYKYKFKSGPDYDPTQPYYELFDILRDAKFETPEALKILARIDKLNLFLSTTFDNYMEKALIECRGQTNVQSLSFAKKGVVEDIPSQYNFPLVYHIFGKVNTLPTYVATEEDLLEFNQKWNDPERRPSHLNSVLKDKEKYYMLLGCSFENWLTRFFLYGVKSEALFDPQSRKGVVADNKSAEDERLAFFLSRCNANLYTRGDAIEFIKELGKRWNERKKPEQNLIKEILEEGFIEGSVFLSYASEDKELANQICSELENLGIDVWFDEEKLESGDWYREKILKNIKSSSLFIPLITDHTITPVSRFFHFEWNKAIEQRSYRPQNIPFIMPLVLGNINVEEKLIPDGFKDLHWTYINNNNIKEFASICQKNVRSYRRTL